MRIVNPAAGCYLCIVCASLVYFHRPLFSPAEVLYADESDLLSMHYPWRYFAMSQASAREGIPLWCSSCFSGQPFHADFQTTMFYPPHQAFYLFAPDWVGWLLSVSVWAHVTMAGLGMFTYVRQQNLSRSSALVGALGFMFAGKWILHVVRAGHYVFVPLCWLPLLMLFLERAIEKKNPQNIFLAGVFAALILLGSQPQITLYTAIMGLTLLAPSLAASCRAPDEAGNGPGFLTSLKRLAQAGLVLGAVAVVTVLLAAIQVLPALEMATFSSRVHTMSPEFGQHYELKCGTLLEVAQTLLSIVGTQYFAGNPWEGVGFLGVSWTAAAVFALIVSARPVVRFYGIALVGMVLFALGSGTPFYTMLQHVVPGLSLFRIPSRILLFAGFPLGMLAAHCTETLFATTDRTWGRNLLAYGALLLVVEGFHLGSYFLWKEEQPYWYWSSLAGPALIAILVLVDVYPRTRRVLFGAWVALLLTDLWAMHGRFVETRPIAEMYPRTRAIDFLIENRGTRVLDAKWLVSGDNRHSPFFMHDLESVRGYNTTDLFAYKQYLHYIADVGSRPPLCEFAKVESIRNQSLLDLLCVGFIACPPGEPPGTAEFDRYWQQVRTFPEEGVAVYQRRHALPRAFVVSTTKALPREQVLRSLKQADLYKVAFLEAPPGSQAEGVPEFASYGGPVFQEARIVERTANRLVVEVKRDQPGCLVLSEIWYPGWRCTTADGAALPILRANTLLRAVVIPAGDHRLEFVFAPRVYRLGQWITLATLGGMGVFFIMGAVRARQRPATSPAAAAASVPVPVVHQEQANV